LVDCVFSDVDQEQWKHTSEHVSQALVLGVSSSLLGDD